MPRRFVSLVASIVALAMLLTGCSAVTTSSTSSSTSSGSNTLPANCKSQQPTLGVSLPNTINPYYIAMRQSFLDNGQKAGFKVNMAIANDSDSNQLAQIDAFIQQGVCAVVLNAVNSGPGAADVAALNRAGIPVISVNVIISADRASPVIIDWTDGARSHPFFDLLIFLRGRAARRVTAQREALVHAYLAEWTEAGVGSVGMLHEAFTVAQRLAPLYHAGSYRRVFGIGTDAATEFAETLPWLLGLLVEASPR